jgi:hypothetical protein
MDRRAARLNGDELGEKGESRFREVCADARLYCNKAERDRVGWDFLVAFPFDAPGVISLDKRAAPPSCRIQVKTIYAPNTRFVMPLSAAERLAKDQGPAFVYILRANEDLTYRDAVLIEILDEALGKVLKRLRAAHVRGRLALNRRSISMSVGNGRQLETTGAALRQALAQACGVDLHDYAQRKQHQIKTIGYPIRPFEFRANFHFDDRDEIVDAFLGLKREIPVTDFEAYETRFDIRLPFPEPCSTGRITIQPHPMDDCTITLRQDSVTPPVVFTGQVFAPLVPGVPREALRILIKAGLFSMIFMGGGDKNMGTTFHVDPIVVKTERRSPEIWANFWRLQLALASGAGWPEIASPKIVSAKLALRGSEFPLSFGYCRHWVDLCDDAAYLLKLAGVGSEPNVTLGELSELGERITWLGKLVRNDPALPPFVITTNAPTPLIEKASVEALYVDNIVIGDAALAFCAVVQLAPEILEDEIRWTSTSVAFRSIKVLSQFSSQYDVFVREAKSVAKLDHDNLIMIGEPAITPDHA